jgi:hypothetical protein
VSVITTGITAGRRGAVCAAIAATGLAALMAALPAAQAAPVTAARPAALHLSAPVAIGSGTSFADPITQAPNGAVYYAAGKSVYVVTGVSAPKKVLTASGKVRALAANSSDFFVEVGKTVTAYKRSTSAKGRHWTLSSSYKVATAQLYAVGSRLWALTDFNCDTCGLEYGNTYRFATWSSTVHRVSSLNVFPEFAAADSAGFYFQTITSAGRIVRASKSGGISSVRNKHVAGPLATAGGKVEALLFRNSKTYLYSYTGTGLHHVYTRRVAGGDFAIGGTGLGLVALDCPTNSCATGRVSQLSGSGTVAAWVGLPDVTAVVPGPSAVVITEHGGKFDLYRVTVI